MASKNTSSSPNGRQKVQRSNSDSARWVAGLLLLFIGLFAASAVLFSFFTWAADQSGLLLSPEERATLGVEPGNLCGWAGARLGRMLVDNSFGVSGILIPVMVLLVGVRVIRQRPLLFNHSILSLFLVLILSSLTLGFAFSDKWSLCSSTGWGGAFGIETAALLRTHIGVLGTLILLLGCWILTGVFINRNFINKVNRAGNVMVDKSGRIVEIVKHKVVHAHGQPSDAAGDAAAVAAESVGNPERACWRNGRRPGRGVCREGGARGGRAPSRTRTGRAASGAGNAPRRTYSRACCRRDYRRPAGRPPRCGRRSVRGTGPRRHAHCARSPAGGRGRRIR